MLRTFRALSAASCLALLAGGCGWFGFEDREAWRTEAEEACVASRQVVETAYMSRAARIDDRGACGIERPFRVAAFKGGEVELSRTATLACPIIPRTDDWLAQVVQPAAMIYFGVPVVQMRSGPSYACRTRNHRRGAALSEHAFGNAIDVMGFRLADGREITVKDGWRGALDEREFLREVFVGACRYYTTVLGPGSDGYHDDHFHVDLARHDAAGQRRHCRPVIKFTPRVSPDADSRLMSLKARPEPRGTQPPIIYPPIGPAPPFSPVLLPARPGAGPIY